MWRLFSFISFIFLSLALKGQDKCSNATALCANSLVVATTQGAHDVGTDPALGCGDMTVDNSVWFTITAFSNGTAQVTITNIDNNPGLEMEAYTGICGSLVTIGACNSANGPSGSMNITFAVTAGTTYYIMVDGAGGNQEAFRITATSATGSITARPFSIFTTNPIQGCAPLDVSLQNSSIINGGTNITYQWNFDGGPNVPSSGNDTTVTFSSVGTHTVQLTVCNDECGCNSSIASVDVIQLSSTITVPSNICPGVQVNFSGNSVYIPSGDPANIVDWQWDFGDTASGPNNTASGQFVQHAFIGAGPSFTVTLIIISADCPNDTLQSVVTIFPKPTVNAGADQLICEGADANLTAVTANAASPITYQWTGVGIFSCDTCQSTAVSGLPSGGPYNISIHIQDGNGCMADSSVNISVNPKPVVDLGNDTTVCRYSSVQLNANVTAGNPPFTFTWTSLAGLNDSTIQNPIATVGLSARHCVVVQDQNSCLSDTTCINVNVFTSSLSIVPAKALCASDPNLNTTFTVTGAGAGSQYQWYLSPDFSLIDSASIDSMTIKATFPSVVATYQFTCIVTDSVTGCIDTATLVYNVDSGLNMTVTISAKTICMGDSATLVATGANTFAWTANPAYSFADPTQATQVVSPTDTTVFTVQGYIGSCTQILSDTLKVNSKPVITVSGDLVICPNMPTQIFSNVTGGTAPFNYTWAPATGLDNPNIQNPTATITSTTTYCAFVMDTNSCQSDTQCVTLTVYPTLSVSTSPSSLCATDTSMKSVLTVNGAGPGSSYQWYLSPDFSLITVSNVDSSSVTATFPQGIAATYNFIVVVIDAVTGCHDTIPFSFTVVNGLNMAIAGANKICNGQTTTLTASGATTYSWSASPVYAFSNPNSPIQIVAPTTTTIFTIIGTSGTCTQAIADTVTVNPVPVAVSAPLPLFCGCDSVHLDGSGSTSGMSYLWISFAGNPIVFPNQQNATSFICSPDSFVLIVMDATSGCGDSTSVKANQKPKPAATAMIPPTQFCSGTPTTVLLDGTGSDTTSGTTYSWTSSDPGTIFADPTVLITTATISITTTFSLIVTDSIGCDSTVTVTVSSYPVMTVSSGPDQTICEGNDAILNAAVTNGIPPITYLWTHSGAGFFSCDTCQSTNYSSLPAGGPYGVNIFVTDSNGCTANSSVNINVSSGPIVTVNNDTTVCKYSTVQLSATPIGTPPFSYAWSPGTGLSDSTIQNPVATVTGPITYFVVVTDGAGCSSNTTFVSLDILPSPVINSVPSALCASDSNLQAIFMVIGAGINSIYNWYLSPDFSLINSASADSSVMQAAFPTGIPATYNFTSIVTDGVTGCIDTVSTSFDVVSGLNMTVVGPIEMCLGDSVTLTAQGANNYTWNASPPYSFSNPNDSIQTVAPSATTIFTINGTVGSCSQTITDTLTVNAKPTAVASPILAFCGCVSVNLIGAGSTPGMIYNWSSSAGNIIVNPSQANTTSNICSSDSFVLIVTDTLSGCADTASTIATQSTKPAAVIALTPDIICDSTSTVITLDGTGSDTNSGTKYLWTSSPAVAITNDTSIIATATISTLTIFYLTVTNASGCDSVVTDTVNIYPSPSIAAFNPFICASDPVLQSTIVISGASSGSTYTWDSIPSCVIPITANTSSQTFDFTACGVGTYWFYVTVTDSATACVKQVRQPVNIITGVTLSIVGNTTICEGDSVMLTASGANNYQWSPGNFTTASIALTGLSAGTYSVSVTGTVGTCTATDSITITVNPVPVTSPINGQTSVCTNDSGLIYSVTPLTGNYTWIVNNGTILQGQNTDSIYVQWDTTASVGLISVVDTNAFGCAGNMQSLNVTINPRPVTSLISGPHAVCDSTMATYFVTPNSGSTYSWIVQGGSIIGSNNTNIINVLWDTTSVGYLIVSETNAVGCTGNTVLDTIFVFPNPAAPIIQGNDTVCEGATMEMYTVPFTVGSTYNWTVNTGILVSGQGMDTIYVNWPTTGNQIITVIEANPSGCISPPDTFNVVVDTMPVVTANPPNDTLCRNDSLKITGTVNTGTIHWTTSGTGTFSDTAIASPTYYIGASDSGSVVLTMNDSARCGMATTQINLTVIPAPIITLSATPSALCFSDSATLVASGGLTYLWSPGGATTDTVVVIPTATTTYTVTVSNASSCTSTDTITVTVNPFPADSINGPTTVCGNVPVTYFVNPSSGNHLWNISTGVIISGQGTDTINVNWGVTVGTDTVFLTTTNLIGCVSLDTFLVNVGSLPPTSSISGADSVCDSSIVVYSVANNPGSTYSWTLIGSPTDSIIGSSVSDSITILWIGPGVAYLSVIETNAAGCFTTMYDTISIFGIPPAPTIIGNTTVCEGDTMELYAALPYFSGATYTWSISADTIVNGQGTDSIYVNWTTTGQQVISLTQTEFGCVSPVGSDTITIDTLPRAAVSPDTISQCRNLPLPITGTSNISNGTIIWTTSGSGMFDNDTILSPVYTPDTADAGSIILTVVLTSPSCGSDTQRVVLNIIPAPVITILAAPDTICAGDSTMLIAASSGPYSYQWSTGETTDTIYVKPAVTTSYTVVGNNSSNCPDTASIDIYVNQLPTASVSGAPDTTVCRKDTVHLTGFKTLAGGSVWTTLGDGVFVNNMTDSIDYLPGANDTTNGFVSVVFTTTGAVCTNASDTITIHFGNIPTAYAGPDTTVTTGPGNGVVIPINGTQTSGISYQWTTSGSGIFSDDSSLTGTYTPSDDDFTGDSVIVTLTVTGLCGTAIDYFVIEFTPFQVPNIFTPYPNTPGYNDFFVVYNLPAGSKLKVWDRWGLLVFSSDDYQNNWDAHGLDSEVFYYILETTRKKYYGWVQVIR